MLTRVVVGDGKATSFWHDVWLAGEPLRLASLTLFSHATCLEITVWGARRCGVHALLVPRLTPLAARECAATQLLLDGCPPTTMPDYRTTTLCAAPKGRFSSREAYALACFGGVESAIASFLWSIRTPSRVKFFGWLLSLGRIHMRDVLLHKTIISVDEAGCPCCGTELETANNLNFRCSFAVQF
ncbi:hypothetical protein D1007_35124 [Hordeum vulgare]|nr:hypothetical protein D1007_35124 [Hordeum vulgare]